MPGLGLALGLGFQPREAAGAPSDGDSPDHALLDENNQPILDHFGRYMLDEGAP